MPEKKTEVTLRTCPICHSRNVSAYFVKIQGYWICGDCAFLSPRELKERISRLVNNNGETED